MTASPHGPAGPAFNPIITEWFARRYGEPTEIQAKAWPLIRSGRHVLMTAPTGSGKTLAAFLVAIDRLTAGDWETGSLRVLYVSPLKALNNDIRRNLTGPLEELSAAFTAAGEDFPGLRVMTRSGDTPQSDRRRMVRRPPEILITTPESLNLLISSPAARNILSTVKLVILDEIHAALSSKRGTHLMSAVERLTLLAGEFQRVAVSATVKPMETIASFVGGYQPAGTKGSPEYRRRDVVLVEAAGNKTYDIRVVFPDGDESLGGSTWPDLIAGLAERIRTNGSTLIFTNSRRMAEKTARLLNEHFGRLEVYAHHGSLSRELRSLVEDRMKRGELSAVIATSSLELGIDIGFLDEVICVQTPFTIAGAVQRAGRSGHGVGEISRVTFYPLHGMDLLSAAVLARAVGSSDIEEARIPLNPLDILAQVILSMTALEKWPVDGLYNFIRTCFSWHRLSRRSFDLVLDMLSGRFADTRIHELLPRIILDEEEGTAEARKGVLPVLYSSGGTIPDRGYYQLRLSGSGALIGELDEEFVWERKLGETFTLGNQTWRITGLNERTVEVIPARRKEAMTPFWRAEPRGRSYHFCRRIREFLDTRPDKMCGFEETAARELDDYIRRQVEACGNALPGMHRVVVEYCGPERKAVIHTFWGWEVNAPFALALSRAWEDLSGKPAAVFYTDACVLLDVPADNPVDLVSPETVIGLLRRKLESTGLFGAMFRENAARALLIPRSTGRKRIPLWLSRLRGKKLLETAAAYDDFPILAETWRSCLEDLFDLPNLMQVLEELADGRMSVEEVTTDTPSPFAADVFFQHTNYYMYADDTPAEGSPSSLRDDYIRDLVYSAELRPRIPAEVILAFEGRIQRTEEGYAPETAADILDLVRQRKFVTVHEWGALLEAVRRDHGGVPAELEGEPAVRLRRFRFKDGGVDLLARPSDAKKLSGISSPEGLVSPAAERLTWFGPVDPEDLGSIFGLTAEACRDLAAELMERGEAAPGPIGEDPREGEICSPRSLEIMLRLKRRMARAYFEPLPAECLAPFLARWSGIIGEQGSYEERLEKLLLFPAEASLWEEDLLPARIPGYEPGRLDSFLAETGLCWLGCGKRRLLFVFQDDISLVSRAADTGALKEVFPHPGGAFSFWDLKSHSHLDSGALAEKLWQFAWQGLVTSPGFEALRRGIESGFRAYDPGGAPGRSGRAGFSRWERSRPVSSLWQIIAAGEEPADLLEQEEMNRERVRVLLSRYGVISRVLLERELPDFRWKRLFPTLRLMEFSGEVVSGMFFRGLPGPQFAAPEALRALEEGTPEVTWWINAADPASLCGLRFDGCPDGLPRRVPSNRLLYRGSVLVMAALQGGRELVFHVEPEDPRCLESAVLFKAMLGRQVRPLPSIKTERVNGLPVEDSPYRPILQALGFEGAYKGYILRIQKYTIPSLSEIRR